jgi:hypothetical protein
MPMHKPSGPPGPQYSDLIQPQRGAAGPLRLSRRPVMTKESNGTAPDLIVLGPDDEGKPRAAISWPKPPRP